MSRPTMTTTLNEKRNLLLIDAIKSLKSGGGGGGLATEATLLSVLNSIVASQDFEVLLVRDTGNGDVVVQQIREYDQGTGAWTTRYEDVNGGAYVVTGPLEYLDPSAVLNLLLTETQVLSTPETGVAMNFFRTSASGTVGVGKRKISVMNVGDADGVVLTSTLKPGETLTFSAEGLRDTLGLFPYDGTGTELLITTIG